MSKVLNTLTPQDRATTGVDKRPPGFALPSSNLARSTIDAVERRASIRRGPLPEVTEVNDDAVWAEFDALEQGQDKRPSQTPPPAAAKALAWINTVRDDEI